MKPVEPLPKRVCIDWDCTICVPGSYEGPGTHYPVDARAIPIINHLSFLGYEIVVLTGRGKGEHEDIRKICKMAGLKVDRVTNVKPPAIIYIDDRAYRFDSWGNHIVNAVVEATKEHYEDD